MLLAAAILKMHLYFDIATDPTSCDFCHIYTIYIYPIHSGIGIGIGGIENGFGIENSGIEIENQNWKIFATATTAFTS